MWVKFMSDISIILESLSVEQYKKMFKRKPIYTSTIKNKKDDYLDYLSHSDSDLKQVINTMIKNNLGVVNCNLDRDNVDIELVISKEDLKFIKFIKSKDLNLDIKICSNDDKSYVINFIIKDRSILKTLNNATNNYLLVNKISLNIEDSILYYIKKEYADIDDQYIKYIETVNKDEILFLNEKKRQKDFQLGSSSEFIDSVDNVCSIANIYKQDHYFQAIPFNKMNDEMIYAMCNKYFESVFRYRIKELHNLLREKYNTPFNINFNKQSQIGLSNYGLSGNCPPFDDDINMELFLYGNLSFCKIDGDKVLLNEDLLGQIMITILHEHEHILQRIGFIDERLKVANENFEIQCKKDDNYYIENYINDPAEIDANLKSFINFNNLASKFGISNPDQVILNKVSNVFKNADDGFNFYDGININNINDVYEKLSDRLETAILDNTEIRRIK